MNFTTATTVAVIEIIAGLALAFSIAWLSLRRGSGHPAFTAQVQAAGGESRGSSVFKYHPTHVIIHWFVVFAMAQLLTRGALIMVNIPNSSPEKVDALRAHALAGILVLILMLFRLVLLKTTRLPPPAKAPTPLLDRFKSVVHPMLYVSIFVQAIAGLGMAFQAGLPRIFFLHEGELPPTFWIDPLRTVHLRQFARVDDADRHSYGRRALPHLRVKRRAAATHDFRQPIG